MNNGTIYSNEFDTKSFVDIFPTAIEFVTAVDSSGLNVDLTDANITTLYYLLYARYGNSHIANLDENQFKYKVYSLIFQYGPTWQKNLSIQQIVRNLTEEEIISGSKQVTDHAYNPSTVPSGPDVINGELTAINEQNRLNYKRSKLDAYGNLMGLLEKDVSEEFIAKFKSLFIKIVEPYKPLFYTDSED